VAENESGQEKTEEATPKKLDKAKEEGQVSRSRELTTAIVLLAGMGGMVVLGPKVGEAALSIMRFNFSIPREVAFDSNLMLFYFSSTVASSLFTLAPYFAVLVIAALTGPVALGGWLFSSKALMPKMERMNPLKGLKRMFSMNSLVELFKALGKFALVTGFAIFIVVLYQDELMALIAGDVKTSIYGAFEMVGWSVLVLSSSLIIVAAIDIPYQIYDHSKKLKMTLQEVKDEMKDTEGKPEVKSRVRQLQREIAQRRMMAAVPEADVVITNPEHFSVALKYDVEGNGAPIVLAKGVDFTAIKIREIANACDILILESPPLARSVYYTTDVDGEIPTALYLAVAQVLAYVFQLKAYNKGEGRQPKPLDEVKVPEDVQFDYRGKPVH
jgi:flagellar biosynthetic protein FlhB